MQASIKNLVVTEENSEQEPQLSKHQSEAEGSIIDILRKQSSDTVNSIGELANGRIITNADEIRSFKSVSGKQIQEDVIRETFGEEELKELQLRKAHSELIQMTHNFDYMIDTVQ